MRVLIRGAGLALALCLAQAAHAGLLGPAADAEPQILPVEEAMQLQPATWQGGKLALSWNLAPGIYLYRDRLRVEVVQPAGYALGAVDLPPGDTHHDEHFGDVQVFRGRAEARFTPATGVPPKRLRVRYQGCAENLVCYPPQTREIEVLTLSP